jgi:hypothetical protein
MNKVLGSAGPCGSTFSTLLVGTGMVLITWNAEDEVVNDLRLDSRAGSRVFRRTTLALMTGKGRDLILRQ